MKLTHLALHALTKTMEYDGNNIAIENLIFEVAQTRSSLEHDLAHHKKCGPRLPDSGPDLTTYKSVYDVLSVALFDNFNYDDHIKTPAHVEWKEYFHSVYHFVVVHEDQEYNLLGCTLKYFDVLTPPAMVAISDSNYSVITYIVRLFRSLKVEHELIAGYLTMESHHARYVQYGMDQLAWYTTLHSMESTLCRYDDIIRWSLH